MNDRERAFVEHYVALGNATRAAIAAGYKDGPGIREQGSRLLTRVDVREAIDERQANIANELGLTRQWVLQQLAAKTDSEGASGVRALELIGKAHGMWVDRAQVDTTGQVVYTLELSGAADVVVDDDPEG